MDVEQLEQLAAVIVTAGLVAGNFLLFTPWRNGVDPRQQRRSEALQLIADGVPPTDAATQLTVKWGCSRRTSLRDIELAQSELANALNSVELQHMVGWLATQYQRLAAKAEQAQQYSAAIGALNSLRAMLVQPQLDRQFEAHFRGRFTHHVHRR